MQIDKWERVFTGKLGVLVRVVVYHYLFSKDMKTIVPTMTQVGNTHTHSTAQTQPLIDTAGSYTRGTCYGLHHIR